MEEFCEVHATMQESNREVGIISSDSYYFFCIITVNENSYVRKLKDMTLLRHGLRILKKVAYLFQVRNLQSLVIVAILNDPHSVLILFLPQVFSTLEHDHFKVLLYLKASLYNSNWNLIISATLLVISISKLKNIEPLLLVHM